MDIPDTLGNDFNINNEDANNMKNINNNDINDNKDPISMENKE